MDKTIEQVKQLAHRYGVPKLVLFGSRARGDYRARSDYD
ncbi:MAG: nucleotidyltransferase family protein, partial [Butyricicoccus sp.]